MTDSKTENLVNLLIKYKNAYYNGTSLVPDSVYDFLEDELRKIDPLHPVLSYVGAPVSDGLKVKHVYPMLSLEKTYDIDTLMKFMNKTDIVCADKLDGNSLSLHYKSGKFVQAVTRGDGAEGEDMTQPVSLLPSIPHEIGDKYVTEIRGELIFSFEDYEKVKENFTSIRNAVTGAIGRKNPDYDIVKYITFVGYSIYGTTEKTYVESLDYIKKLGFHIPVFKLFKSPILKSEVETYIKYRLETKHEFPIDGLVFTMNNNKERNEMGFTSHHPRGALAFKIEGDKEVTVIKDIETRTNRSGQISFRARVDPVELSGAVITYATLHNADFIIDGKYSVGAKVEIIRSGEVIPYISALITEGPSKYILPTKCSVCDSTLIKKGPHLYCINPVCAARENGSLVYYAKTMNMKGISDKIITKMYDAGYIKEPADFYKVTMDQLLKLDGIKDKSAQNILDAIEASKNDLDPVRLLASLGIHKIGMNKSKDLFALYNDFETIRKVTKEELLVIDGWSDVMADYLIDGLKEKKTELDNLLKVVTIQKKAKATNNKNKLDGMILVITGKLSHPRETIIQIIESHGGKVANAITSKTTYLVTNDTDMDSTKAKKAKELKVKMITEEELLKLF